MSRDYSLMLNIAGGVIIGGVALGALRQALHCFSLFGETDWEKVKKPGIFFLIFGVLAAIWVLFDI